MALDDVPDHYATLELEPDCSIEDINRAYKKLAMKNHPDRNRGHEQEAVARFQAVQAAHEVLKEQDTRRRYDLSRRLPTANGSASTRQPAARGNPYKATSNFPPPPMRTNPTRQTQNTANRGAHRGAEGFTHFPPPPPPRPQPKTSTNKDAKDRANIFEAWQSMHGRKSPERKAAPTPSPRMNTPQGGPSYGNNLDPRTQPQRAKSDDSQKSAYEGSKWHKPFVNLDTKPGPPPRRGGFDPSTPSGDERPAPVSGYSQSHVRSDHDNTAGYTQRGPAPTAKKPEPPGYFDTAPTGSSRKGTPNNANTGERTKATAEDLKRPASTPSTANLNQGPERGPFGRPRPRPAENASKYYSSSDSDDIESAAATARSTNTSSRVAPDTHNRPKAMPRSRRSGTTTPLSNPPTSGFDSTKDGSNMSVDVSIFFLTSTNTIFQIYVSCTTRHIRQDFRTTSRENQYQFHWQHASHTSFWLAASATSIKWPNSTHYLHLPIGQCTSSKWTIKHVHHTFRIAPTERRETCSKHRRRHLVLCSMVTNTPNR